MTTFRADEEFKEDVDIRDIDLKIARKKAIKRYAEIQVELKNRGKYILPFASPDKFVFGKNACYTIWLSLVEEQDGEEEVHIVHGEPREDMLDALAYEKRVFEILTVV